MDLGGVALRDGVEYALILDAYVGNNGRNVSTHTGMARGPFMSESVYPDGMFVELQTMTGTREEHFAANRFEFPSTFRQIWMEVRE